MEVFQSIVDALLAMSMLEVIAVFFGIASVLYSRAENILVYPTGIISTVIYIYMCFSVKLYADMGINVFYFVMSIYGWINWMKPRYDQTLRITMNSKKENILSVVLILIGWGILFLLLSNFTDSDVPNVDALTTAICIVGMLLMAWKKVENWLMWIVADIISVPLYWYKGLYLVSIQFFVFTILAYMGYVEWKKKVQLSHE